MNNAEKIKALRKELKMSQQEVADMIGVSQAAIYYWEKNERKPKIGQLIKLAEIFGVPLSYFDCYTVKIKDVESGQVQVDTILMDENTLQEESELEKYINTITTDPTTEELTNPALLEQRTMYYRLYDELNALGKAEAVKRVQELTEIPRYTQKEDN